MRVASSRCFSIALATILVPFAAAGTAAAQDVPIPFRAACDLAPVDGVSAILGVDVTTDDSTPDILCSYRHGGQQVADIVLSPTTPFVLARLGLPGASPVTVGGLSALSSPGDAEDTNSSVVVGLSDGGIMQVQVSNDSGVADPGAAAMALAEAILTAGPVTAHATAASDQEAIAPAGPPCDLVTLDELKQITHQPFSSTRPSTTPSGCFYQTRDMKAVVSLLILTADLGMIRSKRSRSLTVAGRQAVFDPVASTLAVDLGGGRLLGVQIPSAGRGAKAKALPRLMQAIAETAMGRMTSASAAQAVTCPLLSADALDAASGLDLQPIAGGDTGTCLFVTSDEQTGLFLRVSTQPDVAAAWSEVSSSFPDLPAPTDLEVAGHPASGTSGESGTVLGVDLDGVAGHDGQVLGLALLGVPATMTDPLSVLESVATQVVAGM